jgi:phospholipid/cholesterol/gamma-HCH transport system substrate-binding protein
MIEFVPGPQRTTALPTGARGPPGPQGEPLTEGALIEGRVKGDPLRSLEVLAEMEGEVKRAMADFSAASQRVGQLADNFNTLVVNNEDQITRVVQKSELAMTEFQTAMSNINEIVGDEQVRADLKASLAGVPQLIDDTRTAVQKYGAVADQAERSLAEAEKFAGTLSQLGDASQRMSSNVDQITEKLDRLILDLLTVSDAINKQEGTIGQLVYNPDLYQRLNQAACNVEDLTRRMRPIVEDVRVFSDKIARDPGRLGVRGVFQNNDGTKFLPSSFFSQGGEPMPAYPSHIAPYGTQFPPPMPPAYCPPEASHIEMAPEYELPPTAARSTTPQSFWQQRR